MLKRVNGGQQVANCFCLSANKQITPFVLE